MTRRYPGPVSPTSITVNGRAYSLAGVDPHTTVLEFLRAQGLIGTKEGCAEGECGACAVIVVQAAGPEGSRYVPVNGCLTLVGALAGAELLSVEGLRPRPGELHRVQQAMVEQGGSQCGYCTPGFVVSLFAEYYRERPVELEAIAGNLCRCTGYRPIRKVLAQIGQDRPAAEDPFRRRLDRSSAALGHHEQQRGEHRLVRPATLAEALDRLAAEPHAKLIAGGTDVVVEINQRFSRWPVLLALDAIPELQTIERGPERITIGAGVPLSVIERELAGELPLFDELWPLFSSRLVRNRATLGGNLANASPIGDAAPVLLALDAELIVESKSGVRHLPIAEFFLAYRKTALAPGELVTHVRVPTRRPTHAHFYKVSKRVLDDISTVAAALALDVDEQGSITRARLAFGGVAATPARAREVEDALIGRPWTAATLAAIRPLLERAFAPMSDQRGSADYRRAMVVQLVEKFAVETAGGERLGPHPATLADHELHDSFVVPEHAATHALGRAVPHESAEGHVSGEARYTDDLLERHADALHAWPVQAGLAHAEVLAIDTSAAARMPGVVTILTAADVPGENEAGPVRHDEPLFPSEVMFHGQPLAWVLADTLEQARAAAAAVRVELRELPAILTMRDALAASSFHSEAHAIVEGDPEAALASAPRVLAGELELGAQDHFYLETHAALACFDEAGLPLVHSSTQHPSETQLIVARVLGRPRSEVTCQSLRMGGGFGGKETQANAFAAIAALGLQVTGRPVRVRLDRALDMTITGKRHPFWARYRVGHDERGRVIALDLELFADGGWSLDLSKAILYRAMFHCDGVYRWPNLRVVGRVLATHKTSQTAFRGFGGPQGAVVGEELLDRVARACGLPVDQVRAANFYREGDHTHYGQLLRHAERIERTWARVRERGDYERRCAELERFNAASPHRKRGLALVPIKFGISFTTTFLNQAGALVLVYGDGSVQVNHGGTEMGQGLHTKIRQIAADALGVPLASVRLMPTRTDKVPNTSATAASSGTDLNGAAVERACMILRERLAELAARLLGVEASSLEFVAGKVRAAERELAFAELAARAQLERVPLFATGYYATPDIGFDEALGKGKPFHYFTYGAAISEVEVDGFTGAHRLVRVDVVHDVGDSISPLVDRGQIEGGFIQGVGWLTCEQVVWDDKGRLVTRGPSTYKLPSVGECPDVFEVELLPMAREPSVVAGSKAVGEPPLLLAISVREALRAAVAAFASAPRERIDLACPSTPEAVHAAIERVRASP